jgi:hypothetical protein
MADLLSVGEPRVVPTTALGYRFRSTTEARWAVFLRALGVAFEYEMETYDLGDLGWYLPDFWLSNLGMHLEVKPSRKMLDTEYDRARALFLLTQRPVLVAQGFGRPPWEELPSGRAGDWPGRLYDVWTTKSSLSSAGFGGDDHHFTICRCGRVDLSFGGYGTKCSNGSHHVPDWDRLNRAYDEALSFRPDDKAGR